MLRRLVDGCLDAADIHRYSAKYAHRYNVYGTFDSNVKDPSTGTQAVNFGDVKSASCMALGLVNRAINTSSAAYATEVEADNLPDDPDGVFEGDGDPPGESPKLYAKAFSSENEDILILTNRSDVPHHTTPYWNGTRPQRSGTLEVFRGESPELRNCYEMDEDIGEGEVCTTMSLDEPIDWDYQLTDGLDDMKVTLKKKDGHGDWELRRWRYLHGEEQAGVPDAEILPLSLAFFISPSYW